MFIFEIHGNPVAQKQTRFTCNCGSGRCYDPSSHDREKIQWQIRPFAPKEPITGPVSLEITFFMPIPKSTSSVRRRQMLNRIILPTVRPDQDNLAYLITNSLKKIVYEDDNQVVEQHVYKFYGDEPKTIIKVRPISQLEKIGA